MIFAAYFLEAGLFLAVAPWSAFWEHNRWAQGPAVSSLMNSSYARGGVTGIGLITLLAGLAELGSVFVARARRHEAEQKHASE